MNTPHPLTNITAESVCKTLPKECLDLLIQHEIDRRSVWVMANLVFATREDAVKWRRETKGGAMWGGTGWYEEHEPMRFVLDEPLGNELYVLDSEYGPDDLGGYGPEGYAPICFIFTTKEQIRETNAHKSFDCEERIINVCTRILRDGEWVKK